MNKVIFGDCRSAMRKLIADGVKVQTCVTSPPYWNLRDYGHDGQLGLEETIHEYLANQVEVFSLVWDLLADDGTLWVNMGDSYANGGRTTRDPGHSKLHPSYKRDQAKPTRRPDPPGIGAKNLIGMPWRLAFALQDHGWILRQDIIWHKLNPMPESIKDRFTKAHEYIFMFSKQPRYYFDQEAVKEPASKNTHARRSKPSGKTPSGWDTNKGDHRNKAGRYSNRKLETPGKKVKANTSFDAAMAELVPTRNKRSVFPAALETLADIDIDQLNDLLVYLGADMDKFDELLLNKSSLWSMSSEPFSGAHFATFPTALIEPCILAGSRPGDIVLDPFFGSGTTGEVCQKLGRKWIGLEINQEYESLQKSRTSQTGLEFS